MAMKSEIDALKAKLSKAENAAKVSDEIVGKLSRGLELLIKPERKAVTGQTIGYVAKNGDKADGKPEVDVTKMSKAEVTARLKVKTEDPSKLEKSDRDAIVAYYNGDVSVEKIKHLLG